MRKHNDKTNDDLVMYAVHLIANSILGISGSAFANSVYELSNQDKKRNR